MTNTTQRPETAPIEKLTYSTRELCLALGISRTTLWRLEKLGRLHPLDIPGLRTKLWPRTGILRSLAGEG
jgi:hypothetical protein